jgi:polyisoprenoid-binding protein YceI
MTRRLGAHALLGSAVAIAMYIAIGAIANAQIPLPLAIDSARITISGTSNIHAYTASTTTVRVTRAHLGSVTPGPDLWANALKPGAVDAFEIAIAAATLTSPKEGLDKNMHKALKVTEHPDITFRLSRLEGAEGSGAVRGVGILRIAGVEREVTLVLKTQRTDTNLTVTGEVQLLMTDFGITPPKAMLGMLKTDPKVTVTFETVLGIPLT